MLLLNHIFSRICCPMKITHMCVQPGRQPAGCPGPRFSELLWGTPRDGDRSAGKVLTDRRQESWVGAPLCLLLGLG